MMRSRAISILLSCLLAALFLTLPAAARAGVTVTVDDPLEAAESVPDLGRTTMTIGDDAVLSVRTQVVARPPAGWGGCVPLPVGVCYPITMSVSWYFDLVEGGSPPDGGAEASVVATPNGSATTWRARLWSARKEGWVDVAVPTGSTDLEGVSWSLPASAIGLPPKVPTTATGSSPAASVRIVSRYQPFSSDGAALELRDQAGPFVLPLGSLPGAVTGPVVSAECTAATARVAKLDARIAKLEKVARGRSTATRRTSARGELRRLRPQRARARAVKLRACARASQPRSR